MCFLPFPFCLLADEKHCTTTDPHIQLCNKYLGSLPESWPSLITYWAPTKDKTLHSLHNADSPRLGTERSFK